MIHGHIECFEWQHVVKKIVRKQKSQQKYSFIIVESRRSCSIEDEDVQKKGVWSSKYCSFVTTVSIKTTT